MKNFFREFFCLHKHWAHHEGSPPVQVYGNWWICLNCGKIEYRLKGKERRSAAYHYDKIVSSKELDFFPYQF